MSGYDLVIRGGSVANAAGHGPTGALDVGIADGSIVAGGEGIEPAGAPVIDATGDHVLPGLIDPHVHVCGHFGQWIGNRMLARAGVTSALDMAGDPTDLLAALPGHGCGLTVGVVVPIVPGMTVPDRDPSEAVLTELLERSLEQGALGLKALGGHYPITPAALDRVIDLCERYGAYCAVHAGTTETGSDVSGLEELVAISAGRRLQVAHVNSYCRGQIDDPVVEAGRAVTALRGAPALQAESYLAIVNGAHAKCVDGVVESNVVKTCLRLGGYGPERAEMERAVADGWAQIHATDEDGVRLVGPEEGLAAFRAHDSDVGVSFAVNPPAAALGVALSRHADRSFVVGGIGSDGGSFPRNTTLKQGLALVGAGSLSLAELVEKQSRYPAQMLGLVDKGRVDVDFDADLVVATRDGEARVVVAGGRVVVEDGRVVDGTGGALLCGERGTGAAGAAGVTATVSHR